MEKEPVVALSQHSVVSRLNCCIGAFSLYPHFHLHPHSHPQDGTHHHHHSHPHHGAEGEILSARVHSHPPVEEEEISKEEGEKVEAFIRCVVNFADSLPDASTLAALACETLNPSPAYKQVSEQIESFFKSLGDAQFAKTTSLNILADKRIEERLEGLWLRLAMYEGGVELGHARELLAAAGASLSLDDVLGFRYGGDYQSLLDSELQELFRRCPWLPADRSKLHFVFVGAGPMPMSPLLLHKLTGARVTCVDIDSRAVEAARDMIERLRLSDYLKVVLTSPDSPSYVDLLEGDEIVWIASLVSGKNRALNAVREKMKQGVVVVRSAESLYALLYEPVDRSNLAELGYIEIGKRPSDAVTINSSLYFTVPGTHIESLCRTEEAPKGIQEKLQW